MDHVIKINKMTSVLENIIYQNQQIPQGVILLSKIIPDVPVTALNPLLKRTNYLTFLYKFVQDSYQFFC